MPGPARAGVLIYAKNLATLSAFYEALFGMKVLAADSEHRVVENDDIQLVLHAMPAHVAAGVVVSTPPEPREEQAIKPFFTVPSLAWAAVQAEQLGGLLCGPTWDGPGFRIQNVCDPEGNIVQLRARLPS